MRVAAPLLSYKTLEHLKAAFFTYPSFFYAEAGKRGCVSSLHPVSFSISTVKKNPP